jgi:hypothetical protein
MSDHGVVDGQVFVRAHLEERKHGTEDVFMDSTLEAASELRQRPLRDLLAILDYPQPLTDHGSGLLFNRGSHLALIACCTLLPQREAHRSCDVGAGQRLPTR